MSQADLFAKIAAYWDEHIHDLAITTYPVGTPGFFQQLDEYRYAKLNYLTRLVDFDRYRERDFLEVGCGVGIDLVRFARGGAKVQGIDLSNIAIELARRNFEQGQQTADLRVMNGECMQLADNTLHL